MRIILAFALCASLAFTAAAGEGSWGIDPVGDKAESKELYDAEILRVVIMKLNSLLKDGDKIDLGQLKADAKSKADAKKLKPPKKLKSPKKPKG